MKISPALRSLVAALFQRSWSRTQTDGDMDDELRSHIEHRADDLQRSGLARAEAQRQARIEFGGREKYKEEIHEATGSHFVETLWQDVRFSLRTLRKSPGFTIAALLTLALAIGANAVVFSIMNAFILRPLNVPHAESLWALFSQPENDAQESYPNYLDLHARARGFEDLIAYNVVQAGLDTGGDPSLAWVDEASGNYFDALGLRPYLGRFFHASDERGTNSAPYIVLTYAFWRSHFQSDRGVVGRTVRLNKHPFTILGVAPPEFRGTIVFFNPDFFTPIVNHEQLAQNGLNDRGDRWVFMVMGHLKPGVTQAEAIADLNLTGLYLEKTYPKDDGKTTFCLARPGLYGDYIGRPAREFLTGLMLLSGLILLAACANLGSLFAARAADRSREVALRLALGSSRRRILRGLFTEAMLLSLAGGAAGLAGSVMLLRALSVWQPFSRWPLHLSVKPDASVYGLALLLAVASGFLFGAVPVNQVLRTNPYEVVKAGSNRRTRRRLTARELLLVVQIAICAVLVTSSLVAVRGLARSIHGDFGFEPQRAMLLDTDLKMAGYSSESAPAVQKRMIEALRAIPGVDSVGMADAVPLGDAQPDALVFAAQTSDLRPSSAVADPFVFNVSPEYFQAAGTALRVGRVFTWHDDKNSPRVAVVNPEFARRVFGSETHAIGSYFKLKDGSRVQVVGLAEAGKYARLTEDAKPAMFLPLLQSPSTQIYLIVRSYRDPEQLGAAIRSTLRQVDEGLPVYIESRRKQMEVNMFGPRMATLSLGVLGAMGAMLAVTGIFGMAAYSVSKRLREFGIRIALGAQRKEVLSTALGRVFRLLAFGSAVGLALGLAATKVLSLIVSQASPSDPVVLAGAVIVMLLLGLLAAWIPAQRALAVNPMVLLREE